MDTTSGQHLVLENVPSNNKDKNMNKTTYLAKLCEPLDIDYSQGPQYPRLAFTLSFKSLQLSDQLSPSEVVKCT